MSDQSRLTNLSELREDPTYAQWNKRIWNVPKILSEIYEDPTYANPTYARFTVYSMFELLYIFWSLCPRQFCTDMLQLRLCQTGQPAIVCAHQRLKYQTIYIHFHILSSIIITHSKPSFSSKISLKSNYFTHIKFQSMTIGGGRAMYMEAYIIHQLM